MENLTLYIDMPRTLQVGGYGYPITIKCGTEFVPNAPVQVLIRSLKTKEILVKAATLVDPVDGTVEYVIEEGDFTNAGSHEIQVQQIGEGFKYLSPMGIIPVFKSIT